MVFFSPAIRNHRIVDENSCNHPCMLNSCFFYTPDNFEDTLYFEASFVLIVAAPYKRLGLLYRKVTLNSMSSCPVFGKFLSWLCPGPLTHEYICIWN